MDSSGPEDKVGFHIGERWVGWHTWSAVYQVAGGRDQTFVVLHRISSRRTSWSTASTRCMQEPPRCSHGEPCPLIKQDLNQLAFHHLVLSKLLLLVEVWVAAAASVML